jgi:hypothetical protein
MKLYLEFSSLAIAIGLLTITIIQLNTSITTTRTAQRAWLIPARTSLIDFEVGKMAKVETRVQNNGATPAVDAVIVGILDHWFTGQPQPKQQIFQSKPKDPPYGIVVRSGGIIGLKFNLFKVDETAIQKLQSGQLNIRTYGKVFYDDIFGHHHWITFCLEYEEESVGFVACNVGNEMDKDPE